MANNKRFFLDSGSMNLSYGQKLIVTEVPPSNGSGGPFGRELVLGVDSIFPNNTPATPIANLVSIFNASYSSYSKIDEPVITQRTFGNWALQGANGTDLVRVSHSDILSTYNWNTDETVVVRRIEAIFVKSTVAIDYGSSGLTSQGDIIGMDIRCDKAVDTTKILVYEDGRATLYLAPDLCSTFSITSKTVPKNSTDVNQVNLQVMNWNASSGNAFSNGAGNCGRRFEISGSGHLDCQVSGRIATVV